MTLAVIGAGFGRTGTLSLKLALEKLGLGPCYHMVEVFQNPSHPDLWSAAADGELPDWDRLFEGYRASVDWPGCSFWSELAASHPEARVILTLRDSERWYDSVRDTIYAMMMQPPDGAEPVVLSQLSMARKLVLDQTFGGRFEDRAHAIAVYEAHNRRVQESIPPERLLVYAVSEGWEPLCRFLDRSAPDEPFPHVNSTEEFRSHVGLRAPLAR